MSGARSKRIRRIAAAMPLVGDLRTHESSCDRVWWARHDSSEDRALWLVTPISHGTRDEDTLADSNYAVAEKQLTEASSFGEVGTRDDAWPGGVIETLLVRADDAPALRELQSIIRALADYPVLDESHYSELEYERNHPSDHECYADEDCVCEVRTHTHTGDGFGPGYADEDGEVWCRFCYEYVVPGSKVNV